jgi:hypothetical protein
MISVMMKKNMHYSVKIKRKKSKKTMELTPGDFLAFNPHCHLLATDGCFYGTRGMLRAAPPHELKKIEAFFRHKVFKMLLAKGKISKETVAMLLSWRHSGCLY